MLSTNSPRGYNLFVTITESIRQKALTAILFASSIRRSDPQVGVSTTYWDNSTRNDFEHLVNHLGKTDLPERRKIRELLKWRNAQSVLDAGCGSATEYASYQKDPILKKIKYTGLDLSSKMLAIAQERFPGLNLTRGELKTIPFPDKSFDAVVLRHVLEHQPDGYVDVVKESVRVAKKCVIIDFFHAPMPFIPEIVHLNDKKGFANNWYNREAFQDFLDTLLIKGWFVTKCSGSAKQEAVIYTLLI